MAHAVLTKSISETTTHDEATKTLEKPPIMVENVMESEKKDIKRNENPPIIVDDNSQGKELAFNRKKKEYRMFIKLIKANKFTSAMFSARLLGVSSHTIREWLNTPVALKALEETSSNYIKDIAEAKDWKAKAYLLDKIEGSKEEAQASVDLKQMIVINT